MLSNKIRQLKVREKIKRGRPRNTWKKTAIMDGDSSRMLGLE